MEKLLRDNSHGLEHASVTINEDGTISVSWIDGFKIQIKADSILSHAKPIVETMMQASKHSGGLHKITIAKDILDG